MSQTENQQVSMQSQSRTQKSPNKQASRINYRSNHSGSHTPYSNIQIEYARLKQQTKKQLQITLKENQQLRDQIYRRNQQIEHLKSTVIVNLKKDLNDAQRQNIKNFKQIERQARQIQKLISDNHSMQQNLEKSNRQRKNYFAKLDQLKQIKQTTRRQILQKDKIIRTYAQTNKNLQKQIAAIKVQNQDILEDKAETQRRLFQSQSQYKSVLQKGFVMESQLRTLQLRQRDNQLMLNNYAEKLNQQERQREELLERLDQQESRIANSHSNRGNTDQIQLIQIKALMDQIYTLLDDRKQQNKNARKKFFASIACLEKVLLRK